MRRWAWVLAAVTVGLGAARAEGADRPLPLRPAAPGATAAAPGATTAVLADRIEVLAPGPIRRRVAYNLVLRGLATRPARAHLFVDYAGCAAAFAAEQRRAPHDSYGYVVSGAFTEVSGWTSSSAGIDHACAYLVAADGRQLARARLTFQVH